ncbi:MAG: hypothetical protein QNK20_04835, partial [Aureibaculum sp.]|nr:hypothetical protein [Aureibaculum sp.]
MEILRKTITIGLFTLLVNSFIYAQSNFINLQEAFSKSYVLEAQGDFKLAADEIKAFYDANSYETNLRLGWLNYMAGNFNESIAFYQKSMELMP